MNQWIVNRKFVVIACVFVSLHGLAWYLYHNGVEAPRLPISEHLPTTGGHVQAQRVVDFVTQTAGYTSFDACAVGLNDALQEDIVFDVKFQSQDPMPQMSFAMVLADRRAAKLYAYLTEMHETEAARRAADLFDQKLEFHRSELEHVLTVQRQNETVNRPISLYRNQHAGLCALFLCADFCEGREVLAMADRWESALRPLLNMIASEPQLADWRQETMMYGCPERLFLANLYCHILSHRGSLQMSEIPPAIGWKIIPDFTPTPFCKWDATVTPFDFSRIHLGAKVDKTGQLVNVNLMKSWGSMDYKPDFQVKLLEQLRRVITERQL